MVPFSVSDTSNCMRAKGGIYAKFNHHTRKALHGIVVLGLIFSTIGAGSQPITLAPEAETGTTPDASTTGPVSDSPNQCLTEVIRITLASEQIYFCTPISQPYNVIEDNISDPYVSYAQLNQVNGYGIVNIKSVTPGYTPGIGRPVYDLGGVGEYRRAVWTIESLKTDRVVSNGSTGVFWNETVPGIQIDTSLPTSLGNMKVRSIEWYVEHNSRLWSFIITWDTEIKNSNEWNESSKKYSIQKPEGVKLADTAINLGTAFLVSKVASGNPDLGVPIDVGTPSWWSGVCDDDNYFEATGVHSIPLGASWHGVPACGPVTYRPPYPSRLVRFFPGAWGEFEFECVELVMRFLYQEWGIKPWIGNGNTIKNSPPDSIEFYINNGTHAFVPGDIITEDGITQSSSGHAMIITGVDLDGNGTGTISIMEQNTSSNGSRLLNVNKWKIDPDGLIWGQAIQGWLHTKDNHGLKVTIYGNLGIGDAMLSFDDNGPQTATAASDGTYSLTVSYNWSGTVTPSKTDYTFRPASRTYTNSTIGETNQNYTATPDTKTTGSVSVPDNTFTGTLTLPSGWLNGTTISAHFVGTSSAAAINAGALSNDNNTWGDWVAATPDVTTTTSWDVGGEGANRPVYLRLRDVNDQVTTVVSGTVNVDLTNPTSTMTALPASSPANIALSWSGSDALSGPSTYDVQVRAGLGGAWTDVLSSTTNTSTNYTGANGITYYFRTRASDVAGNVEDWSPDYDTFTVVDADAPIGTVVINTGVAYSNETSVTLTLSASDSGSGVAQMSFRNNGSNWWAWERYATSKAWTLSSGEGSKTVYARYKDNAGNMSATFQDDIILDVTPPVGSVTIVPVIAGMRELVSDTTPQVGASSDQIFTVYLPLIIKSLQVNLLLTATDDVSGVGGMLISNNMDFSGANWEVYALEKSWGLIGTTVYVKYRDNAGNVSLVYSATYMP